MIADLPNPETINIEATVKAYIDGDIDLICVLGPTASGKTRYAVRLAHSIDGILRRLSPVKTARAEILSGDSRQVYRGMDIGTGKDLSEYGDVPYHLINIAEAGSKYDLYQFQRDFEKAYKEIRDRGNVPILCGGSGLYIEAATCGYEIPDVPADPSLREELEERSDEELIALLSTLKTLHNKTDIDTRKRMIRAIEIGLYQQSHPVTRTSYLPKKTYFIGTLVSREERNRRIDARLDARLSEGLTDEVKRLIDSGIHPEDLIYYGLEYKFVTQYVLGIISLEEMRTLLSNAIHQFAKRQMTWFRGMERKGVKIHWTLP